VVAGVIGKGLFIKGELHGEEDLIIEGSVEGTITMQKSLTIESGGRIKADIATENITIRGEMEGSLTVRDKISIHNGGRLIGDMTAPRIEVEDGAYYKGKIEMVEPAAGASKILPKRSKS
jgi:cytoskeletal protein CcmA (bactofilin family)